MKRLTFILAALLLLVSGCQKKSVEHQKIEDPHNQYEKYRRSVVLVRSHSYYSVEFNKGFRLFFVLDDKGGPPVIYQDESEAARNANVTWGTGFLISRDGQIATNRRVVDPSTRGKEAARFITERIANFKQGLEEQLKARYDTQGRLMNLYDKGFGTLDREILSGIRKSYGLLETDVVTLKRIVESMDYDPATIKIKPHLVDLNVVFDDTWVTDEKDFQSCVVYKTSNDELVDMAIIQLKDKHTPDRIKDILPLGKAASDKAFEPGVNEEVYMIGFNGGLNIAQTGQGVNSQFTSGKITQQPDGSRILYSIPALPGSGGSPVLDHSGHLVAVNFARVSDTQEFNFGIPVRHLIALTAAPAAKPLEITEPAIPAPAPPRTSVNVLVTHTQLPAQPNEHDNDRKARIIGFIKAEDSRDFEQMTGYLSNPLKRYWSLTNPNLDEVRKRCSSLWCITSNTKNIVKEIKPLGEEIFDLYTEYEYYDLRLKKTISKTSRVRFHFDSNGKIDEMYGVQ